MSEQTRNLPTEIFITGTWNANTNITSYNIALESGVGNPDEKYRVTDAGATNLDGISAWAVNDIAYFDYTTRTWQKIDNQTNSGVTGSGTLNYVPLWTPSGTQLGNSIITQSAGGNAIQIGSLIYGIFALTPDAQYYTVNANVKITQGLTETKITDVATGTHTVLSSEYIFNCTGTCTINLPATTATNVGIGKVYRIFAGEAVTVTITPDGADTIDGAASATVIGWGMVTLRVLSNGNWRVGD